MKTTNNILEVMFEGDKTKESKKFEDALLDFFEMLRINAGGANVQIIKSNYEDSTQLSGVYKGCRIGKKWTSMDSLLTNIAENIGFEIAERYQCSDSATLVNESGFKLRATLENN